MQIIINCNLIASQSGNLQKTLWLPIWSLNKVWSLFWSLFAGFATMVVTDRGLNVQHRTLAIVSKLEKLAGHWSGCAKVQKLCIRQRPISYWPDYVRTKFRLVNNGIIPLMRSFLNQNFWFPRMVKSCLSFVVTGDWTVVSYSKLD